MHYFEQCPLCGRELNLNQTKGRPTRWCSPGCKTAGEAEMRRIDRTLRISEEGRLWERLNDRDTTTRDEAMKELTTRYHHLAGVPSSSTPATNDSSGGDAA